MACRRSEQNFSWAVSREIWAKGTTKQKFAEKKLKGKLVKDEMSCLLLLLLRRQTNLLYAGFRCHPSSSSSGSSISNKGERYALFCLQHLINYGNFISPGNGSHRALIWGRMRGIVIIIVSQAACRQAPARPTNHPHTPPRHLGSKTQKQFEAMRRVGKQFSASELWALVAEGWVIETRSHQHEIMRSWYLVLWCAEVGCYLWFVCFSRNRKLGSFLVLQSSSQYAAKSAH